MKVILRYNITATLTNITVLLPQSCNCSYYVSIRILIPPPLWLQYHIVVDPHDFVQYSDYFHQTRLPNVTLAWRWKLYVTNPDILTSLLSTFIHYGPEGSLLNHKIAYVVVKAKALSKTFRVTNWKKLWKSARLFWDIKIEKIVIICSWRSCYHNIFRQSQHRNMHCSMLLRSTSLKPKISCSISPAEMSKTNRNKCQ